MMRNKKLNADYVKEEMEKFNFGWLVGWLAGFYGISPFVGYLTPNPFLCK